MQRIKIYKAENVAVDTLEPEPDVDFFLVEETLEDAQGNVHERIVYDYEETIVSREVNTYDAEGRLVKTQEFNDDAEEPDRVVVREFDPNGLLFSESVLFFGEVTEETKYVYNSYRMLIEKIISRAEDGETRVHYYYLAAHPDCCEKEAYFADGKNYLNVYREWHFPDGSPFLAEEKFERFDEMEKSKLVRYYDPKTSVNNVQKKIFNRKGNFIEEYRMIYDEDLLARTSLHKGEAPDNPASSVEEFRYNTAGKLVESNLRGNDDSVQISLFKYLPDGKLYLTLGKAKTRNESMIVLEKWVYETVD